MRKGMVIALVLALVCALALSWLAWSALPEREQAVERARAEAEQMRARAEAIMAHGLAIAVFSQDYGEAQNLVGHFAQQRYFPRGIVINLQRQIVAAVDAPVELQVGKPLPQQITGPFHSIRLELAGQAVGELIVLGVEPASQNGPGSWYGLIAWIAAGLAWIVAILLFAARRPVSPPSPPPT